MTFWLRAGQAAHHSLDADLQVRVRHQRLDGGALELLAQRQNLVDELQLPSHQYYFEGVANPDEVAEDMAVAVVPTQA